MNQQAPFRTTHEPTSARQTEPRVDNRPLARLILLALAAAIVLLAIALTLCFLALSQKDPSLPYDPDRIPAEGDQSGQNDPPVSAGRGAVATVPSRSDYTIKNRSDYQTLSGVQTQYAVLVDLDSYTAIAGKGTDVRVCPASMTKVMTVLVVAENLKSLDDRLVFTADVINESLKSDGSGLKALWTEGYELSVEDLMYLAFMQSDTAACKTLANYIAGSEEAFAELMNKKAREIGMHDTVFSNSTGLSIKGETYYSTCRDIAMLMAYALDNPLANRVLTATDWTMKRSYAPISDRVQVKPTWLTERLGNATLETVTVKGGKTGYETAPGACLVSYATSNSRHGAYVLVVVGGDRLSASQSTKDVKYIYNTYAG